MTFGYRSRPSRGGFRSSRGGSSRGSFRGRGRGSDSFFRSGRGSSYNNRSSHRGGSFRGSSFHDRDDYYESRSGGSKYSHDKYGSSHSRRDEDSYHHRETRESSGSFGREHSRRNDFEPERKKMKSEPGNYKEGASPRRSYDDLEHSSRSYNSSSSSYHTDTSPFKSHKKHYGDFKKPLPVEHEYSSRRPTRGMRARGGVSRTLTKTIKPLVTSSLKRISTGRISKASSATRLQLLLRRKKQLRIMRLRRAREERERVHEESKSDNEQDVASEEEEDVADEDVDDEDVDDEGDPKEAKPIAEPKKIAAKEVKKEVKKEPEGEDATVSPKVKKELSPARGLHKKHITLKCVHCKTEYATFRMYLRHLQTYQHKKAMENLLYRLKQKLGKMRSEQRSQQRILDEQCEDFARTSYCKLCKLNYKQTRQEHYTSDFHISMSEFRNPKCSPCCMTFQTPILYEQHRCTLAHIKRKASIANKKKGEPEIEDDNNEEDNFMVLDSVGSADESNDENEDDDAGEVGNKEVSKPKKDSPKIVGNEYIKKVTCYFCKLCGMCLRYNPNVNQEELLLSHCRTRFHLKRYSLDQLRKKKAAAEEDVKNEPASANDSDAVELEEQDEKQWTDENGDADHKMSEDEDDSKSSTRYDRFGYSDEKENVDKQKANAETSETADAVTKGEEANE